MYTLLKMRKKQRRIPKIGNLFYNDRHRFVARNLLQAVPALRQAFAKPNGFARHDEWHPALAWRRTAHMAANLRYEAGAVLGWVRLPGAHKNAKQAQNSGRSGDFCLFCVNVTVNRHIFFA